LPYVNLYSRYSIENVIPEFFNNILQSQNKCNKVSGGFTHELAIFKITYLKGKI